MNKKLVIIIIVVALVGFIDASYLTYKHFARIGGVCPLSTGCDVVTTSEYSEVFGVPVALGGSLYYLTILILSTYSLIKENINVHKLASIASLAGLGASIWFVYIMAFVIKAYCTFCLLSAVTSSMIFILSLPTLLRLFKKEETNQAPTVQK